MKKMTTRKHSSDEEWGLTSQVQAEIAVVGAFLEGYKRDEVGQEELADFLRYSADLIKEDGVSERFGWMALILEDHPEVQRSRKIDWVSLAESYYQENE